MMPLAVPAMQYGGAGALADDMFGGGGSHSYLPPPTMWDSQFPMQAGATPEQLNVASSNAAANMYTNAFQNMPQWDQPYPGAGGMPNIPGWEGMSGLQTAASQQLQQSLGGMPQFNADKYFGQGAMDAIQPMADARMGQFRGLTQAGFEQDLDDTMALMNKRGILRSGATEGKLGDVVSDRSQRMEAYGQGMQADELQRYGQMGLQGYGQNLQGYGLGTDRMMGAMGMGMEETGMDWGHQWNQYNAGMGQYGQGYNEWQNQQGGQMNMLAMAQALQNQTPLPQYQPSQPGMGTQLAYNFAGQLGDTALSWLKRPGG